MIKKLIDGDIKYYSEARELNLSGDLLLFTIINISSLSLRFSSSVEISKGGAGIAWIGSLFGAKVILLC